MADKKFIGRVYDAKFSLGKLVLNKEDINALAQEIKSTGKENVSILLRQSQAGKLYAEIDTWQPTQTQAGYSANKPVNNQVPTWPAKDYVNNNQEIDELPF